VAHRLAGYQPRVAKHGVIVPRSASVTLLQPLPHRRQTFPGQELEACHALLRRRVRAEQA